MKVYIAGAITDNPNYKEQFKAAEERLRAAGHAVINPCKNEGFTYREYINMGLCELMHCDAIYLLKGYDQSTGAVLELDYARSVGLEVMSEAAEETAEVFSKLGKCCKKLSWSYPEVLERPDIKSKDHLLRYLSIGEQLGARTVISADEVKHVKKLLEKDNPRAIIIDHGIRLCPYCGSTVSEDNEYCSQCGQHLR